MISVFITLLLLNILAMFMASLLSELFKSIFPIKIKRRKRKRGGQNGI